MDITFDALEATRKLREAGFDEKPAEAVVRVLSDAQSSPVPRAHPDAKFAVVAAKMDKRSWIFVKIYRK